MDEQFVAAWHEVAERRRWRQSLVDAGLPGNVAGHLMRGGYHSPAAAAAASDADLLRIQMIGPTRLALLRRWLAPYVTPPAPLPAWVGEE